MGESFEWVEIIEPSRREHMFANLKTGQCLWDPPSGVKVKPTHENQWWELYDTNTSRYYYYNATSQKTVWRQPKDGDIIALAKLQMLKAKEVKRKSSDNSSSPEPITSKSALIEHNEPNNIENDNEPHDVSNTSGDYDTVNELNKLNLQNATQTTPSGGNDYNLDNCDDDPIYQNFDASKVTNLNTETSMETTDKDEFVAIHSSQYENEQQLDDNEENDDGDEEATYQNLNFLERDSKTSQSNTNTNFDTNENDDVQQVRCSTLPRTSLTQNFAPKPQFNSFRYKEAPKKPPRISTKDSFKISVTKSTGEEIEEKTSNKENIPKTDAYNVSVQSSPRMNARSISKPIRAPPTAPLDLHNKEITADSKQNNECRTSSPPPVSPKTKLPLQSVHSLQKSPVPDAPPLPKLATTSTLLNTNTIDTSDSMVSVYDNVRIKSVYDNLSDNEASGSLSTIHDTSSPMVRNQSAPSDDTTMPKSTLLRSETAPSGRTSYYERLTNEDVPSEITGSQSARLPESTTSSPVKRSPLTRMKSDSSDIEKRSKHLKTMDMSQQFRPVSMMNITSASHLGRSKRIASESDIPEQVPLNTHRKGLFRRRMSIHSMLSWSKSPIKKPMVLTTNKQQRKDSVEVFKLILQYMGDKSSRKNLDTLSVDITTRGWNTPSLRDEIYIQLCKQTTGNDKSLSLRRGWELITACLTMFPPSSKFQSYLEGYIYRNLDSEDQNPQVQVDMYAKYCYKQLERICQTGAKRGLKGPTTDEIHAAIKRVFNPSMFGNSLEDIMDMQKERYPERRLPWILTTLTDAVLLQNGLQTEGIFRVPGDIDEVNSLKVETDGWELPQTIKEPYAPASLLKLWFRDLYEPLIPQRFYDQCIHNCDNEAVCLNIVNSLPPINNLIFSYLIRLLQAFMIPENVLVSKMDENNLAMVWAPNCLRCPSDDPLEILENTRKEMTFLRTVMKKLDTSFLEGVV